MPRQKMNIQFKEQVPTVTGVPRGYEPKYLARTQDGKYYIFCEGPINLGNKLFIGNGRPGFLMEEAENVSRSRTESGGITINFIIDGESAQIHLANDHRYLERTPTVTL